MRAGEKSWLTGLACGCVPYVSVAQKENKAKMATQSLLYLLSLAQSNADSRVSHANEIGIIKKEHSKKRKPFEQKTRCMCLWPYSSLSKNMRFRILWTTFVCVCMYVCIYIYIYMREKLKNKLIQSEGFIVKESRGYNFSVLINHHQDFRKDDIKCL